MLPTVTGVSLGASAVRAVRLALREGQLELVAAAAKELVSAARGAAAEKPEPSVPPGASQPAEPLAAEAADGAIQLVAPAAAPTPAPTPPRPPARPSRPEAEGDAERERELRADLASLLRRSGIRSGRMVLGLGGTQALIRYVQVPPVPPWKLEMMMKYEVQEQGSAPEPSAFDYRILELPDVGGQFTVMLAQVQEKKLLARMDLAHYAGMGRPDVDLNCLGLFNAYVHGHGAEADRTVLLVDIGAENLDLVVARGPVLCFARSVPGGGARFTASAAEAIRLSFEEAEDLKRAKGRILSPDAAEAAELPEVQKKLSAALEGEIGGLAGVIDSSLMYCRAQTKQPKLRPDEILVCGGGSMLPGLPEALARRLRMRVNRLEPFRKISLGALAGSELEEVSAQAPRYAVAVGLAASRLVGDAVRFSMVPEAVKVRRRFLEGGIYMWYAAGIIWLVAAMLIWAPWRNKQTLAAELEKRRELTSAGNVANAAFEQSYANVEQRGHEVEALEERVYSGRDIVKALSHLKKHTGGRFQSIIILEASNTVPAMVPEARAEERTQSFQKARYVYLRGVASAPVVGSGQAARDGAAADAHKLVEDYRRELEAKDVENDIVVQVIPRYQKTEESAAKSPTQVRVHFVLQAILKPMQVAAAERPVAPRTAPTGRPSKVGRKP